MASSIIGPCGPRIAGRNSLFSRRRILRDAGLCSRCSFRANRSFNPQTGSFTERAKGGGIRYFHHGRTHHFPSMGVLLDEKSRESFQTELEREEDIYTYLLRWQNNPTSPNIDPILPPEVRRANPTELSWVGNMIPEQDNPSSSHDYMAELNDPRHSAPTGYENARFLRPGNIVEMRPNSSFVDGVLAVYVRTVDRQLQFYTSRGRWMAARESDVNLLLDESVPIDYLSPVLPYFPTSMVEASALPQFSLEGGVPRQLASPLISILVEIEQETNEFYTQHSPTLDDIHNVIADKSEPTNLTLDEIAKKALDADFASLNARQKYAIHKALQRKPFYVIPNSLKYTIESYRFRSKKQSKTIDTVVEWARTYQDACTKDSQSDREGNSLEQFARKARSILKHNRQFRTPTESFNVSPSQKPSEKASSGPITWVKEDPVDKTSKAIITFLLFWILPPGHMASGSLEATGSTILRATQMYGGYLLDRATAYMFLQELGVLSPWQNLYLLQEQLELPGHGTSTESDKLKDAADIKSEELKHTGAVDKMENFRKDWGDLPVFCIDSPDAFDIDDGISLEPVEGSPDTFWIRVHVANPSAFIDPDNEIAQAAAHFKQSLYFPEGVYPMLPGTFTQEHVSLAPGRPALTISARVNMDGLILETDIVSSRVNNVLYRTPKAVSKLFSEERDNLPTIDVTVPGTVDKKTTQSSPYQDTLLAQEEDTFRTMQKLLAARLAQRVAKGGEGSDKYPVGLRPRVSMGAESLPSWPTDGDLHRYDGDPAIELSGRLTDPLETVDSTKSDLVSHAMLLAGEVTGQWCKDRDIPVVFSSAAYNPEDMARSAQGEENGSPTTTTVFPRSFSSSKPAQHASLGMDQYIKCTSPLRRYPDLITHWQIDAFLRGEKTLPFSEEEINKFISRSHWQNVLQVRANQGANAFWICQIFHRALNFNEIKLPETFQCLITTEMNRRMGKSRSSDKPRYLGALLPFRMRCLVSVAEDEVEKFQAGDLVDVKVTSVHVYNCLLSAEVERLVRRPEEGTVTARSLVI